VKATAILRSCALILLVSACAKPARLPLDAGMGPNPTLPAPTTSLIPMVNVAKAVGWRPAEKPTSGAGLVVSAFADGLDHPRWLYVLPNGDVLVAETNAPKRPDDSKGIRGWIMGQFMQYAGAAVPSANRITLLRDADGDGRAEKRSILLAGLNSPFGIALIGSTLYVANADAVVKFPYIAGDTAISALPVKVTDLPGGTLNHHWTKSLIASPDGSKLYVGVGSNSNVAENGIDQEKGRAAIWEINPANGSNRLYATGLRNPVGLAWESETAMLWVAVNERDDLGSDLVPDYITSVRDGGFYGWPYSYFGQIVDQRVKPQRPDLVAKAIKPDYALGPHTGSLGLSNAAGNSLPVNFRNGMFIGQHGSWNRKPRGGYRVIFVPFDGGKPVGEPVVVLSDFLSEKGDARGRPVGLAIDRRGALLVADDVGNVIWRVTAASQTVNR
jgi:glucose/arabinose dehydrogenase